MSTGAVSRRILPTLVVLLLVVSLAMIFGYAPIEQEQKIVQKIFYIHVPCAWVAFMAFGVTAFKGLRYLMTRDLRHDASAAASAEVGLIFVTLVLVTGPLWARPVWGIYWTWDLRLTTTFVLWLLFIAYLVLRRAVDDPGRRATLSAVVGLVERRIRNSLDVIVRDLPQQRFRDAGEFSPGELHIVA